jgi:hypothetical protein
MYGDMEMRVIEERIFVGGQINLASKLRIRHADHVACGGNKNR